jgi:hypothetical protein
MMLACDYVTFYYFVTQSQERCTMAQTAAERQAACRRRRATASENGERQINTWVTTQTHAALRRLAKHHGIDRRAMLEKLLIQADKRITSGLNPTSLEWDAYFVT